MITLIEGPRASGKTVIAKGVAEVLSRIYKTEVPIYDQYDIETGSYINPYDFGRGKKTFYHAVAGYEHVIFVIHGSASGELKAKADFTITTSKSRAKYENSEESCKICGRKLSECMCAHLFNKGWICPKCGTGVAPWVNQCPCTTNYKVTRKKI